MRCEARDAPNPSSPHQAHLMEHSDGAKRPKLSDGSDEDRLGALPDDILIHVLDKLRGGIAIAARTSVLSRRWRGLWALLPELHFPAGTEPHRIRSALTAHQAPTIRSLVVNLRDAAPDSVSTWLPIAAPRLSGDLFIMHYRREAVKSGAVELPCVERATAIWLNLDDFGLTLPPSGVFGRLTDLRLLSVELHGPCSLGDIVSSPRCPSLRKLFLRDVRGLGDFVVHSESLLEIAMDNVQLHSSGGGIVNIRSGSLFQIELKGLLCLRQLTIVAPGLRVLKESSYYLPFDVNPSEPVARISAPQLMSLDWKYYRGPRSIQFDKMPHLFWLYAGRFLVYGSDDEDFPHNRIGLLQCFEFIFCLYLTLVYSKSIANDQYLMEDMPRLPHIMFLSLNVEAKGHSFGASLFHVLRMCAGVRKLGLAFNITTEQLEEQTECPPGCICDQQPNWKTDELQLSCLENIEISAWRGTGNEVAFVERLFSWATVPKEMTVTFHPSVTESIAKDLCQTLLSFSRPEACSIKFQIYHGLYKKVPYVPED